MSAPVHRLLDELEALVTHARSMPMSASCVVHRGEVLELVDGVRSALPGEIQQAGALIEGADAVVDRAHAEAERLLAEARAQAALLVADQAVVAAATSRAQRLEQDARAEASRLLAEADDYCDRRLADFEIDLDRLAQQVRRGREKLRTRGRGASGPAAPEPPAPEPLAPEPPAPEPPAHADAPGAQTP